MLGLSKDDLISSEYSVTNAISMIARQAGFRGLIVPSAKFPLDEKGTVR